jgi:hypothetical protein
MNRVADFHLPGDTDTIAPQRLLPGTTLQAPVLTPQQIRRIWQGMQRARSAWMQSPVDERIERLARVGAQLRAEGPGDDAPRLARSTGLSEAGLVAAWDISLSPWNRTCLEELLRSVRWGEGGLSDAGCLPHRLLHVLSGNVLPPIWSLLVRSWLLGAATWLRPAAREPLFASIAVQRAARVEPLLADLTAVTWWPHDGAVMDPMGRAACELADVVTAHGSDATIDTLRSQLRECDPQPRFVGYGSRWSAVLLGAHGLTAQTAAAVARDVALFDQQGCLSPTHVFAPPGDALESWCGHLADALAEQERVLPRGEPGARARASLRHWAETMRLHQVQGRVRRLWGGGHAAPWCVVLTTSLQSLSSPLDRSVIVQPLDDAEQWRCVFESVHRRLQGVATAPQPEEDAWLQAILQVMRPTRVCPVGSLQEAPPAWRQDHLDPLRSLLVEAVNGRTEPTRQ